AFDDVWGALDEGGGRFVLVHPVDAPDPRLRSYYLTNLLGNPYETAVAAAFLIFSDAVSRFPRVNFCLAHAGGATAMLVGRWQHGYETKRPGLERRLSLAPAEAVKRLYVDSIAHSGLALDFVGEVFGPDHVLLGSDWPFPMGDLHPKRQRGRFRP